MSSSVNFNKLSEIESSNATVTSKNDLIVPLVRK